jgi:starch-binding outer membrane protein, SusD/RagB family
MLKQNIKIFAMGAMLLVGANSCSLLEVDRVPEPNSPTVESILTNATAIQIQQLGVGVQAVMRNGLFDFYTLTAGVGREAIVFAKTDSRYYSDPQGNTKMDPSFFPTFYYNPFNQTRRRAELFYLAAAKSTALSAEQKSACKGFAKTVQAHIMLNCLNMQYSNGIRTSFGDLLSPGDLLKPGKLSDYAGGLAYVKTLADEGAAALDAGGAAFPFPMAKGWAGFNTPATMKKFNRAVAARIAMHQKDWTGMTTALNGSFLDLAGALKTGPKFNYATTSGDATNPLFQALDDANRPVAVQIKFVPEAEAGDTRVFGKSVREGGTAKIRKRTAGTTLGGFPVSEYELQNYVTNTSDIDIIRNEELILMAAEAAIQTGKLVDGEKALDIIRVAAGLKKLADAKPTVVGNKDNLINELLNQRRYSLFLEGHRWFDVRRYGRLATLPKDIATHNVLEAFPSTQAEVDWDTANP